jgi:hypothetical protein
MLATAGGYEETREGLCGRRRPIAEPHVHAAVYKVKIAHITFSQPREKY